MRVLTVVAIILLALAITAWVAYRMLLAQAFVAAGRGPIASETGVQVLRVRTSPSVLDFDGKPVEAGDQHKYVLLDLRISAPAGKAKLDDFQLVKDKVSKLGSEENIGDNMDRHYFYWTFLDSAASPIKEVSVTQAPFDARIAFKVPSDAEVGYLFYWGYYWGPLHFGNDERRPTTR